MSGYKAATLEALTVINVPIMLVKTKCLSIYAVKEAIEVENPIPKIMLAAHITDREFCAHPINKILAINVRTMLPQRRSRGDTFKTRIIPTPLVTANAAVIPDKRYAASDWDKFSLLFWTNLEKNWNVDISMLR